MTWHDDKVVVRVGDAGWVIDKDLGCSEAVAIESLKASRENMRIWKCASRI